MASPNQWTAKRLYLVIVFAIATFAASFLAGAGITAAFGPGMSGVATIIVTTIVIVVGANIAGTRPYFTIAVTIFTLLAIPTSMFGPPGPYKVVVGLITGIAYDLAWELTGRRRFSLPIAAAVSTAVSIFCIYKLMVIAFPTHPRLPDLQRLLPYLIPAYAVLGFIGGWIGNKVYTRSISRISVLRSLQE